MTGSFTNPTGLYAYPTKGGGFALFQGLVSDGGYGILDEAPFEGLVGYTLTTSIGPVTGTDNPGYNGSVAFSTSVGDFDLFSVSSQTTFQAATVPEPSSLVMAGAAAAFGLGVWSRRRNRR